MLAGLKKKLTIHRPSYLKQSPPNPTYKPNPSLNENVTSNYEGNSQGLNILEKELVEEPGEMQNDDNFPSSLSWLNMLYTPLQLPSLGINLIELDQGPTYTPSSSRNIEGGDVNSFINLGLDRLTTLLTQLTLNQLDKAISIPINPRIIYLITLPLPEYKSYIKFLINSPANSKPNLLIIKRNTKNKLVMKTEMKELAKSIVEGSIFVDAVGVEGWRFGMVVKLNMILKKMNERKGKGIEGGKKEVKGLSCVAVPFNLLEREFETSKFMEYCQSNKLKVFSTDPIPTALQTLMVTSSFKLNPPQYQMKVYLNKMAKVRNVVYESVVLNYLMCKDVIPLPSLISDISLKALTGSLGWRLTPYEVTSLDLYSADLYKYNILMKQRKLPIYPNQFQPMVPRCPCGRLFDGNQLDEEVNNLGSVKERRLSDGDISVRYGSRNFRTNSLTLESMSRTNVGMIQSNLDNRFMLLMAKDQVSSIPSLRDTNNLIYSPSDIIDAPETENKDAIGRKVTFIEPISREETFNSKAVTELKRVFQSPNLGIEMLRFDEILGEGEVKLSPEWDVEELHNEKDNTDFPNNELEGKINEDNKESVDSENEEEIKRKEVAKNHTNDNKIIIKKKSLTITPNATPTASISTQNVLATMAPLNHPIPEATVLKTPIDEEDDDNIPLMLMSSPKSYLQSLMRTEENLESDEKREDMNDDITSIRDIIAESDITIRVGTNNNDELNAGVGIESEVDDIDGKDKVNIDISIDEGDADVSAEADIPNESDGKINASVKDDVEDNRNETQDELLDEKWEVGVTLGSSEHQPIDQSTVPNQNNDIKNTFDTNEFDQPEQITTKPLENGNSIGELPIKEDAGAKEGSGSDPFETISEPATLVSEVLPLDENQASLKENSISEDPNEIVEPKKDTIEASETQTEIVNEEITVGESIQPPRKASWFSFMSRDT